MRLRQMLSGALVLFYCGAVHAQVASPGQLNRWIDSLAEPGQGLAVTHISPKTGLATFASSPGKGIAVSVAKGPSAEARARTFVDQYGKAFGLTDSSQVRHLKSSAIDEMGIEHVRLQQMHKGVPITGGEMMVHLKGSRVMTANARTLGDLPDDVVPTVTADLATFTARRAMTKYHALEAVGASYSEPRLEILNRTLLTDKGNDASHLAWFIEATGPELRQFIWIDAQKGGLLLNFSQLTDLKNRSVYTANSTEIVLPGILVRTEGGPPTGDADNDNAYTYAGITYDYYLNNHGRDSWDGLGGALKSTTHYCQVANCPNFANAFWNGEQMVYGNTYASADDVVGHELTHAVTQSTAALYYYMQSGALNESFSDIFGETIDLGSTVGGGNDSPGARWSMGEDLPIGAIRNMMNPGLFNDPAQVNDANFKCSTQGFNFPVETDHAGVHSNSGVPNHAYALMVDGGSFNSKTITGIGLTKAAKIEFRTLTFYLTSGSGFIDDYNALNQSCTDLIGTLGITSGDCTQVKNALDAVEMNQPWGCFGANQTPTRCSAGQVPQYTSFSGFEDHLLGNWTLTTNNPLGNWAADTDVARSGRGMATGTDPNSSSIHNLTMINSVAVPAGGKMFFDHLFEFENDDLGNTFDGGIFEYSIDNGTTWVDANSLIEAGHSYDGVLDPGNPFGARQAFTGASYGYTGSRLNLNSLAGQNVKFRFRIGSDSAVGALGWLLDNVSFYTCVPSAFTDDPLFVGSTVSKAPHVNELRARVNSIRVRRGLTTFGFTDPTIVNGSTRMKALHITEMRAALAAAYTAAGYVVPVYTDPGLAAGTAPKAAHIRDLRNAVLAVEAAP